MDLGEFIAALQQLDGDAIVAAAAELDHRVSSAAGEVSWWRATLEIERQLRLRRAGRRAALAANQAATAVTRAAARAGIELSDMRVTLVARAAADVARGLAVDAAAAGDLLQGVSALCAA